MDDGSSSSFNPIDAVVIPLASLSIIACIISLVVLIYFKLYLSFIYRLVFYSFTSLVIFSLGTIAFTIVYILQDKHDSDDLVTATYFISFSQLAITSLLTTALTLCICVLVLCNHQFTYIADIVMVVCTVILVIPIAISYTALSFFVCIFLTVLALVPLCGRACGYKTCVKTIRTKESHRKALKEILPLLILPLSIYFTSFLVMVTVVFNERHIALLFSGVLGLITALTFALHLCCIGKTNLSKQQGRMYLHRSDNQPETSHSTEEEGNTSESCNTEDQHMSKGEEDTQHLLP